MSTDVVISRTIVFPVTQALDERELQISPVAVVEEKEKLQVMHDLVFGGQATV